MDLFLIFSSPADDKESLETVVGSTLLSKLTGSPNKAKTRIGSEFKPESRVAPIDLKLEPQTVHPL